MIENSIIEFGNVELKAQFTSFPKSSNWCNGTVGDEIEFHCQWCGKNEVKPVEKIIEGQVFSHREYDIRNGIVQSLIKE